MRADAARNRATILAAARRLIAALGPEVPMETIAAEAGVAVGTLYRHHPTKADLVAAVFESRLGQVADLAEAAGDRIAAGGNAHGELEGLLRSLADENATDQAMHAAGALLGARDPLDVAGLPEDSAARRAGAALERVLDAARRAGDVRSDATPADLTTLIAGAPEDPVQRGRYLAIVLDGLRPVTAGGVDGGL